MKLDEIAISLIEAVGGIVDKNNIEGVVQVFEGIRNGVHGVWEEHLAKDSEDLLMYDEVLCECGRLIDICKYRNFIHTKLYEMV